MEYKKTLLRLIELLEKSKEEHWALYFKKVLKLYEDGKVQASYKEVLGAYGGMGSFNDISLNFLTDDEYAMVENIRTNLWQFCKANKTFW